MNPAEIRAQALRMISFLDERRRARLLSPEEHTISVGEIIRWAEQAIAKAKS
jgi:hypothetical protein